MSDGDWAALARELATLSPFCRAYGHEIVVAEPERCVVRTSGQTGLCRQTTGQWVGEALEVLASITAGFLSTSLGETPGTFYAPYGATVRTMYHLRPSSSSWVEADARWIRRGKAQAVIETVVRDAEGRELLRVLSQHVAIPEPLLFSLEEMRKATKPFAESPAVAKQV